MKAEDFRKHSCVIMRQQHRDLLLLPWPFSSLLLRRIAERCRWKRLSGGGETRKAPLTELLELPNAVLPLQPEEALLSGTISSTRVIREALLSRLLKISELSGDAEV
ncbi:hypothetical protein D4764_16G0009330 [Takifugu flavidus]|uniref:Uncharacterized protein n=1 Tax=Takifugu flavidus TaxID=433684 RepID=A0A5C6P010_9TELE|nr:hypothetical protein D4764_16G0009330 [Takifugu flavidus]